MKILSTVLILLIFPIFSYGQTDTVSSINKSLSGNNELKINLAYTVAGFPEITYERLLKNNNGLGVSIIVGLESHLDYKFGMIPHYRLYFGKQKANGFFIEGNAAVIAKEIYYYTVYDKNGNVTGHIYNKLQIRFGLGAASGFKFLTKNGIVGEAYLGLGGIYRLNKIDNYLRSGVTIGKRF